MKNYVVVAGKKLIWKFAFFCYQTVQSELQSTVQKYIVYVRQFALHIVQWNWTCGLGRYPIVTVVRPSHFSLTNCLSITGATI